MVPKGITMTFWQSVQAGADTASREFKKTIIWRGPYQDKDLDAQIAIVRNYLHSDIKILLIAPIDAHLLAPFILQYQREGKKVIIFDSALVGADYESFISTDNQAAGYQLASSMAAQFPNKPQVLIVQNAAGHASTEDRVAGFTDYLKQHNISNIRYIDGGSTKGSALHATKIALADHPGINVIFSPNESTTEGASLALLKMQRAGVMMGGFDLNPVIYEHFTQGLIHSLVLQDPFIMGYIAVEQAVKLLNQQPLAKEIHTPIRIINKQSIKQPEIKAFVQQFLVSPDTKQ